MTYFLLVLVVLNVVLQIYDWWSTLKILKGPDGKLGTRDDGREVMAAPRLLMDAIGVRPAIAVLKVASIAAVAGVFVASQVGYVEPTHAIIGLALLTMITLWLFVRHNFKHDGIG